MMKQISVGGLALLILAVTVLLCYAGESAIQACYQKNGGQLRIVGSPSECRSSEVAISWDRSGPQGPQGIQGPAGPPGPPGASGASAVDSGDLSVSDLLGTWQCEKFFAPPTGGASTGPAGYVAGDKDGFFSYTSLTLNFMDDGDGTVSYTSSPWNAIQGSYAADNCNGAGRISSFNGFFVMEFKFCKHEDWGSQFVAVTIKPVSGTMIEISQPVGVQANYAGLTCQKQ